MMRKQRLWKPCRSRAAGRLSLTWYELKVLLRPTPLLPQACQVICLGTLLLQPPRVRHLHCLLLNIPLVFRCTSFSLSAARHLSCLDNVSLLKVGQPKMIIVPLGSQTPQWRMVVFHGRAMPFPYPQAAGYVTNISFERRRLHCSVSAPHLRVCPAHRRSQLSLSQTMAAWEADVADAIERSKKMSKKRTSKP